MDLNTLLIALLKLIHVAAAAIWFGAGLYLYSLAKADLADDFALATRYNAMLMRNTKTGLWMPVASLTTTVVGVLLYLIAGYYNRGFGGLGSIIFHLGVLLGIAATVHGGMKFGSTARAIADLTRASVNADGTMNNTELSKLNTAQQGMLDALNIHVIIVVGAFVCMVLGSTIFP